MSVIEGDTIPYQDWAIEKRNENREDWQKHDVGVKCFIPEKEHSLSRLVQ